jgi:hypothetical protein
MDNGQPSEPDSIDNRDEPTPETPQTHEAVITSTINENNGTETRLTTTDANNGIASGEKNILDRIKTGERWMILFTAIVAFITVAQFIQSGCSNRSTSKQVDKIIGASNTQALAASSFAASAKSIDTRILATEGDFQRMAINADKALLATQQSFRDDQRAWLGIDVSKATVHHRGNDLGDPEEISIPVRNSGKTPALDIAGFSVLMNTHWDEPIPKYDEVMEEHGWTTEKTMGENFKFSKPGDPYVLGWSFCRGDVLAPGEDRTFNINFSNIHPSINRTTPGGTAQLRIYLLITLTYTDLYNPKKRRSSKLCTVSKFMTEGLSPCPTGQEMD